MYSHAHTRLSLDSNAFRLFFFSPLRQAYAREAQPRVADSAGSDGPHAADVCCVGLLARM